MSTLQHRVRLNDHRGPVRGRIEIAPGVNVGDEDLVALEVRSPRFHDTPLEIRLLLPRKELLKALGSCEAPEEPQTDQDQVDRSWALERAGEVLGRLAAVGALPPGADDVALLPLAEWILNGTEADHG